ncbi:YopX family protein [Bacillus subtilis]|uniref:YopX family protein n=1 Tax=Bacillus subtilis TaxID=1423 RepID=UPI00034DCC91|nr:YopX family protein [Bacillus subtilis]KIN32336.1 hypothetical protein B4070_4457 [Bacillus subtilis]MCB4338667.1 hypothetical protein [Bacillus subtilis]MCM3060569.1 YopX family protein [Bacillus subtilis]MED4864514.1 YopX family protein [Bacillus subtilis]
MREIKFRAWDENSQEMIYEVGITPEGIPYSIPENAEGCDQFNYFLTCHKMQYTGLRDKYGREIYEGDVVRNHRRYSNELLEVFWQEEVADYSSDGVYWTKEVPGFRFKRINKGMMTVFVANVDLEVIGNIYEDPELQEASHASK